MATLRQIASFLKEYESRFESLKHATGALRADVEETLSLSNVAFHVVMARAKKVDSIRNKLLAKSYKDPARGITDQIGIRIIVYRAAEVDRASEAIRRRWHIIKKHSVDKRTALHLREFGYRSMHLVCRVRPSLSASAGLRVGFPKVCEIQIRSLLEHSWAEIEHGVVYKSGVELPDHLRRRFASLAGAAELMEGEFERLSRETRDLVDEALNDMSRADFGKKRLDAPRATAILEKFRPMGDSLRFQGIEDPTPAGIQSRIVAGLRRCGVRTAAAFAHAILEPSFQRVVKRFADLEVVGVSHVSHLAICILLIGFRSRAVLETFFPEFLDLPAVREAIDEV